MPMSYHHNTARAVIALFVSTLSVAFCATSYAQDQPAAPQEQILFTMGQIEVFSRVDDTTFTITDLSDGSVYLTHTLVTEGDRFSRTSGVPEFISVTATQPVTLFTGKALAARNDWSSVMNADNNTEFGYRFHGFTEHYLWIFVPRADDDPSDTTIEVTDLDEGDDTVTLTSANATRYLNSDLEVYALSGFDNDALIVNCSHKCVAQVGSSSIQSTTGWSFSPPSIAPGEDGREVGTRFAFFANPDLTVWPLSDDTEVEIIDHSDGDDSRTIQLDQDQFFSLRDLSSLVTGEREVIHASGNLFEQDIIEVRSNRPILVTVGPNYDPGGGFTLDFAPTVPTGQDQHESFIYANGVGAQLLTYDQDTTMTLTTISGDSDHTLEIAPSDWSGVGPYYYTAPFSWSRELIHVVSNRPTVIFYGDFIPTYYPQCCSASFVPVIAPTRDLPPVAEAGISVLACPYDTIAFDASGSFDQDSLGEPPAIRSISWDFDVSVNSDGEGGADDDVDSTEVEGEYTYPRSGVYQVRLSVEDNEGVRDDDYLYVTIDVSQIDLCGTDDDDDDVGEFNDNCPDASNPDQLDLDLDGQGDACDEDIDGDDIDNPEDNCERAANPDQLDADQDGLGDACDDDIDGDLIPEDQDSCPLVYNPEQSDLDDDGIGDECDDDIDGDGALNEVDSCPRDANPDQVDSDDDGIGDACDIDVDGDGINNMFDNCPSIPNRLQYDADGDGLGDECDEDADGDEIPNESDTCPLISDPEQADEDGDGVGDLCDEDGDGDGVNDAVDTCPTIADPDQADADSDGIGDACDDDDDDDGITDSADNCALVPNIEQVDTDGDGLGDLCDDNDDDDDYLDEDDRCPLLATDDQTDTDEDGFGDACEVDDDNDQIPDEVDNCPVDVNVEQLDFDGDGVGDRCDDDDDDDGLTDLEDLCPFAADSDQVDTDGDGAGDACDPDDDNDGLLDVNDSCQLVVNSDQLDTDGDGSGDACDDDDDGDGLKDEEEIALGTSPTLVDTDQDGVSDGEEVELDTDPLDGGITPPSTYGCDTNALGGSPVSTAPLWLLALLGALMSARRRGHADLVH